jgi:hypothetical protein
MPPSSRDGRAGTGVQLAVKIALSVVFGVVAFATSQLLDAHVATSTIVGVGASVFIGGVAFVTQFLIEVTEKVVSVEDSVESLNAENAAQIASIKELVRTGFRNVSAATDLFGLVEASALRTDEIVALVQNSTEITERSSPLVARFAQAEIARLSTYLKELGQGGDVTYDGEDRDWLLGLTKVSTATIDATSLTTTDRDGRQFVDSGFWSTDLGQQYLQVQSAAIARGVQIRRVFIVDRPEFVRDSGFRDVLEKHREAGIEVRMLDPRRIPPGWRSSFFDFVLFDNALSYQTMPASRTVDESSQPIVSITMVTNPSRVRDRIERFRVLWNHAVDPADVEAITTEPVTSAGG